MFNNWDKKDKCILVTKSNKKGSSKGKVIINIKSINTLNFSFFKTFWNNVNHNYIKMLMCKVIVRNYCKSSNSISNKSWLIRIIAFLCFL